MQINSFIPVNNKLAFGTGISEEEIAANRRMGLKDNATNRDRFLAMIKESTVARNRRLGLEDDATTEEALEVLQERWREAQKKR